jgi:beta-glucosidase
MDLEPLPPDFLWGVSSSAFQCEGGALDSNWQRYMASDPRLEAYRDAVDFRHRYAQDIALAADLGVSMFRIGVNWARVEPQRGAVDPDALAYYDDVIATMARHAITPLITLDHWVYPGWIYEQGSWANADTIDDFVVFAGLIVERYPQLHRWLTFNEPSFYRLIERGRRPLTSAQADAMTSHLVAAHRRTYDFIHARDPGAQVSSNMAWLGSRTLEDPFLRGVGDTLDYIGVDYYYAGYRPGDWTHAVNLQPWKAQIAPFGIYETLCELHRRFPDKPILIAENGIPTHDGTRPDDYRRGDALGDTIHWVQRARQDGVPVIGYLYWSLTDNYEWGSYAPRFGLYSVDAATDPKLTRTPTDAVAAYRSIIAGRGVPSDHELVRRPLAADAGFVNERDRPALLDAV